MAKKITRPTLSRWGGFDYEIRWKPQGDVQHAGEPAYGETDHVGQAIDIEEGLKPEREVALLIHEPLHQMIGVAKVVFHGEPDDIEEQVCTFVGDAISGHIRDNPEFWRYLIKRLAPRKRKKPTNVSPGSPT